MYTQKTHFLTIFLSGQIYLLFLFSYMGSVFMTYTLLRHKNQGFFLTSCV